MSCAGPALLSDSDPPKVLLVDDEATGRRLLRRWIERGLDGHVVEAENGLEALEALAAEEFDLVVLDLMMPVLDGTETLSLIRGDPAHGDIEVIVATQLASEQKVRDVISLGVADYILKPLRYESVVERLRQVAARARERRKEKRRKSGLPVVLIADADPYFCDFAVAALSGRCHGISARTAAETLVAVLKNQPHLVLLGPNLPGLPAKMLGKKVLAVAKACQSAVCRITETQSDEIDEEFAGKVVRTFVPENFAADVMRLVAGNAVPGTSESWLRALEPEISSAVRQAMGMMTGFEPASVDQRTGGEPDMFVVVDLRAESGEFDLVVELQCRRSFGVALCSAMLGTESSDVDNELLISGAGEILNVVGGRMKNSCANRKIDVLLGLPKLIEASRDCAASFYEWERYFVWREHCFRLSVVGMPGTMGAPAAGASVATGRTKAGDGEEGGPAGPATPSSTNDSGTSPDDAKLGSGPQAPAGEAIASRAEDSAASLEPSDDPATAAAAEQQKTVEQTS